MKQPACNKRWAVEALADGRISEREIGSLERHLESCESCRLALSRSRELSRALSELPERESSDLDRRRAREALLSAANERLVSRTDRRISVRGVVVGVALAASISALWFARSHVHGAGAAPSTPSSAVVAAVAPDFEVRNVTRADFTSERQGTTSRVVLRDGTAAFHVEHVRTGARFLVALPDGEIEVRGTRFSVTVEAGHTRRVNVTEGIVSVRVAEFAGDLVAGQSWPASPSGVEPNVSHATRSEADAGHTGAGLVRIPATIATVAVVDAAPPAPSPPQAGPRFSDAMTSFVAGDYGDADRKLSAFVIDFPSDSRAEDAMFLRIDARRRRGDTEGAKRAARDYLERYPTGLRAPEAKVVVDGR